MALCDLPLEFSVVVQSIASSKSSLSGAAQKERFISATGWETMTAIGIESTAGFAFSFAKAGAVSSTHC